MKEKDRRIVAEAYAGQGFEDYLDLGEATEVMGMKHVQYVRRLLHESVAAIEAGEDPKFPWPEDGSPIAVKLQLGGFEKWFIHPESAENYEARASFGGTGLRRYLLRFNESTFSAEQIQEALEAALGESSEDTYIFEPAYKGGGKSSGGSKGKSTPKDFTAEILSSLTRPHPRAAKTDLD